MDKNLLGAHCTGSEPVCGLRHRLGRDRKSRAVGAVFNLQTALEPGRIAQYCAGKKVGQAF